MNRHQKAKVLETAEREIERAAKSIQPRNQPVDAGDFWGSTYAWLSGIEQAPPWQADSRLRDAWLRTFWPKEPHLAGVLNSSCLIDSNRGWSLVGGRNQVRRFSSALHSFENGRGWRFAMRKFALSFRTADIGFIGEVGTDIEGGPLSTMWGIDPARCKLTGNSEHPITYYPARGRMVPVAASDVMRIASMVSTDETYNELGYCALSRAVELAQIMVAVYAHDQEQLGARAPRGLLLLQNISEGMWESAMKAREDKLDSMERRYYGGVAVLTGMGPDMVDAKLVALSSLPANFDRQAFTDLLMFGYALCFGYDPNEFWPVQSGALGRGRESEIQHQKATGKGVMDFTTEMQEGIQRLLPLTVEFTFDERDDDGELRAAEVQQAKVNVVKSMYETGLNVGAPMIDRWQAQQLLAEAGLIPEEWTLTEESSTVESEDAFTERLRLLAQSEYVMRAISERPAEPIIEAAYRGGRRTERVLFECARDVERYQPKLQRVARADKSPVLYQSGEVTITEDDVTRAIADGGRAIGAEWLGAVTSEPMTDAEIAESEL